MNSPTVCFQPPEVDAFLDGDLTPEELARAEEHLADCEGCRSAIELAIGPEQWWSDVQRSLRTHDGDLTADEAEHVDQHEDKTSTNKLLELLGPSDDPAMLGRIGSYEITALLGQGGMGAVFKGFDRSLNRFVAIKVLLPHLAASGAARQRFAREGQAVAAVVDNHVMPVHCVDEWCGVPYLVMPYARGVSLQKRLNDEGPLDVREILRIGMQAAKGLAAAHAQGIVHRDVKPANILLDAKVERIQLMDFGLARAVDDASLTRSGTLAGTPQYMSPEQARAEKVDQRSDLFSLGAVLYAMCVGHAPFRAESSYSVLRLITDSDPRPIREVNPDVPEWLCHVIEKLMAKRADDRYQSAEDVAELLESCLAHVQQPTDIPLPRSLIPRLKRKSRFALPRRSLGVITVVAAIGAIVSAVVLSAGSTPPDIAGNWKDEDGGLVKLVQKQPGEYEGTFTVSSKDDNSPENVEWKYAATLHLQWSRFERRFNGIWQVGDRTNGKISLRFVDGEIRGALTTKRGRQGQFGTPRLGDFRWTRAIRFTAPLELPAEQGQVTRIYPISHLPLWTRDRKKLESDLLLRYLKTIDSASWADGTTRADYNSDRRSLIVSTSKDKHEQIAKVLNGELPPLKPRAAGSATDDEQYTVAYPIGDLPLWTQDGKRQSTDLLLAYLSREIGTYVRTDKNLQASNFPEQKILFVTAPTKHHMTIVTLLADLRSEKVSSTTDAPTDARNRESQAVPETVNSAFRKWFATVGALQGKWLVVSSRNNWRPTDFVVEITGDMIAFRQGQRTLKSRFTIDSTKSPKWIDIDGPDAIKAKTLPGIYKLENDVLTICHHNDPELPPQRPQDFDPAHGAGISRLILVRILNGKDQKVSGKVDLPGPGRRISVNDALWNWRTVNQRFINGEATARKEAAARDAYFRARAMSEQDSDVVDSATSADTGTPLLDAIRNFNQKYRVHEIGKNQPPLTDDEVIASIRWAVMSDQHSGVPDPYRQQLQKIAELRQLPPEWTLKVATALEGVDGERFQAWSIRLAFNGTPDVAPYDHFIRDRMLWQLDADGKPMELGKLEAADNAADSKPLAVAIHGFNASHSQLAGPEMPPLTEEEVVAAIRLQKTRRNDFDITDGEFARMQRIADTRRLPADAEISIVNGFLPGDGYRYDIWSVRFSMRKQVNTIPHPFTGFTIREHYVRSQSLDLDKITWGPVAENGLQAGVRFEPRQAQYFAGQTVTPYFYYRNAGDRKFDVSFPNVASSKPVAVDNAGVAIPVDADENEKWIVGFIAVGEFGFGSQHEIRGRPIVLGDAERGDAEFAIRAKVGQAVRVHFVLPNYGDQRGSQLKTGEIAFSMAEPAKKQSRTDTTDSLTPIVSTGTSTITVENEPTSKLIQGSDKTETVKRSGRFNVKAKADHSK